MIHSYSTNMLTVRLPAKYSFLKKFNVYFPFLQPAYRHKIPKPKGGSMKVPISCTLVAKFGYCRGGQFLLLLNLVVIEADNRDQIYFLRGLHTCLISCSMISMISCSNLIWTFLEFDLNNNMAGRHEKHGKARYGHWTQKCYKGNTYSMKIATDYKWHFHQSTCQLI